MVASTAFWIRLTATRPKAISVDHYDGLTGFEIDLENRIRRKDLFSHHRKHPLGKVEWVELDAAVPGMLQQITDYRVASNNTVLGSLKIRQYLVWFSQTDECG
jgi:hypothetical protein